MILKALYVKVSPFLFGVCQCVRLKVVTTRELATAALNWTGKWSLLGVYF